MQRLDEYFDEYKKVYPRLKKIWYEVKEYSHNLLKKERDLLKIAEAIEKKTIELGAKPAFPVNLSINEIAAHFTPEPNEHMVIKNGDLLKVDFGIHIDGYIFDGAYSVCIGECEEEKLQIIKASEEGLEEALKVIKSGVKVKEIADVIESVAEKYGLNPVRNLGGHGLGRYTVHLPPTLLNGRNEIEELLLSGMPIAMEVFMTNGVGAVKDSFPSRIFELEDTTAKRMFRDFQIRKMIDYISKEIKTIPFCKRWLNNYPKLKVEYMITRGISYGLFRGHPVLKEVSNGLVAQSETSLIVE